jgi:hypothetical protein
MAPGDEGGAMTGAGFHNGTTVIGDLDVWCFTAHVGNSIVLQMAETVSGSSLYPYLRLYGPNAVLLNSTQGDAAAGVTTRATNSGTFTAVAGNREPSSAGGDGTYPLTRNGLSDGLKVCIPVISGTNLNLGGIGGPPGTNFVFYTTRNFAMPAALRTPILTSQFDQFGVFDYTNVFNPAEHQRYHRLSHP